MPTGQDHGYLPALKCTHDFSNMIVTQDSVLQLYSKHTNRMVGTKIHTIIFANNKIISFILNGGHKFNKRNILQSHIEKIIN